MADRFPEQAENDLTYLVDQKNGDRMASANNCAAPHWQITIFCDNRVKKLLYHCWCAFSYPWTSVWWWRPIPRGQVYSKVKSSVVFFAVFWTWGTEGKEEGEGIMPHACYFMLCESYLLADALFQFHRHFRFLLINRKLLYFRFSAYQVPNGEVGHCPSLGKTVGGEEAN